MSTRAPTNFTTQFPELGTGPIDVGPYRDPDYFEREKAAVFARTWLVAGRDSQIPNPGDYFVRDVPTFDLSLIFVRGKDGQTLEHITSVVTAASGGLEAVVKLIGRDATEE